MPSKLIGGERMTYSRYLYETDTGKLAYFFQWDYLAAQLNLVPCDVPLPHVKTLVFPRTVLFLSTQGYRLTIVVPNTGGSLWTSTKTIGWFGYLYSSYRWKGEQPR